MPFLMESSLGSASTWMALVDKRNRLSLALVPKYSPSSSGDFIQSAVLF